MAGIELLCNQICPLPNGCADKIEQIDDESSLRGKTIILSGTDIGDTSVVIEKTKRTGLFDSERIMSDQEYNNLVTNGIDIDKSSIACPEMIDRYNYLMEKNGGAKGGSIKCNHTKKVTYGSGSSSIKRT